MKKATLLTSLLALVVFSATAQQIPLLKPTEVSVQTFLSSGINEPITPQDFQRLISNDDFIPSELMESINNDHGSYYGHYGFPSMGLNLNLGFKIRNTETNEYYKSPVLRLGVQYYSVSVVNSYNNIKEKNRIDTLVSPSTNKIIYIDSVKDKSLNINKQTELINLDFSVIFRTDTSKQWSLFGGAGMSTGFSINSYTDVSIRDYSYYSYTGDYNPENMTNSFYMTSWEGKQERHHNKLNFMTSIYLPLGVDVRLGQQTAFWRRLHLFYEARPGVSVYMIPELRTITKFSITHGAGLMVRF